MGDRPGSSSPHSRLTGRTYSHSPPGELSLSPTPPQLVPGLGVGEAHRRAPGMLWWWLMAKPATVGVPQDSEKGALHWLAHLLALLQGPVSVGVILSWHF